MITRRTVVGLILLLPAAVLLWIRLHGAISFEIPLQNLTSGDEPASLFAIWKAAHGQDVYTSRFDRPYNAVFFNWLFYAAYGAVVKSVTGLLSLADPWLPTIARLFTLSGAVVAGSAFLAAAGRSKLAAGILWAALLGPLTGFWLVTARPDIWSLALETAALAWFVTQWRSRPWAALLGFALGIWLAWSFKQSAVAVLVGIGLFLLLRREFVRLAVLVAVMAFLFGSTLLLGTPAYRSAILFSDVPLQFSLSFMLRTAALSLAKAAPVWLGLAVAGWLTLRRFGWRACFQDDRIFIVACTCFVGLGLATAAVSQNAAAENYFFSPTMSGGLLLAFLIERHKPWSGRFKNMTTAGLIPLTALALAALVRPGQIDLRAQSAGFAKLQSCVIDLKRPVFVNSQILSLPWMLPDNEPFVLSYAYQRDRDLGRKFQDGGIAGLAAAGHFASIALPGDMGSEVDGVPLVGYTRVPSSCPGMGVWLRNSAPGELK